MNWQDTVGCYIKAKMVGKALQQQPDADMNKLLNSISRASLTVGIARDSIADVLDAEVEALAFHRALGNMGITIDYMAGWTAASDLVRYGKHAMNNDNDTND
jgi:hypothetical protein